ncbi:hypothetical protein [Salinarimonas sp.]|uniref:hypothetical protein n=1 Tax=Salinarimonas sp. TaxID=2766526 RepID=UPI0032D8C964
MTRTLLAACALSSALAWAAPAHAHGLDLAVSVDCEAIRVEASFAGGRPAGDGEVRLRDGANALLATVALASDGTAAIPLDRLDASGGFVVEVETSGHGDYRILTPEDVARACPR